MDFILKDADIQRGDEVVTSGLGGVYPAGLLIGYVGRVYRDRTGLFQYADIVPAADLRSLDVVFVVTPGPLAPVAPGG
jgi:rod shape-determining protein MreC